MIPTLRILANMGSLHRLAPFWVLAMALAVWLATPLVVFALVWGVAMQFFVEYAMHRFLMHRAPPADQGVFNQLYRSHIGHHEFPGDPEFFTGDDHWYPVRFGLISAALHMLVLWPVLGLAGAASFAAIAIFGGSASAFAFYEYCHTLAHLRVPKGWFGQRVTQSHMAHHFRDHRATFHVSFGMGWIDRLFGTPHDAVTARARFDRRTMLSMGMDPDDLRLVTARKAFGISRAPRGGVAARPE
ncbi:MAG: fatty acid hydroxylase family protein [Limimaricola sp.]|uniref:sterol desaturase family protein n=1 Tax=Limimaricola sp. TaxID=2211665 RepID=UPI001DE57300|nr:sterol desaturase family protein [Limimaricola sp.]MBI1417005.1 fatty acid hydroxylase family protein [Limimaricola sp.]